ncbi:hypothetical protein ACSBR2_038741 [Camellia fascicularis]
MASSQPNYPPFEFATRYYCGTGDSCVRQSSFFGGKVVLNQGVGYSIILGFGAFFVVFTSFLVWLDKRYVGSHHTSEWFNTTVHVVLVAFVYLVYTSSSKLGSPSIVYHRLLEVPSKSRLCQEPLTHNGQSCGPVDGNYKGSYLTMLSSGGLVFGIINIVGNFVPCLLTMKNIAVTSAGSSELIAVSSLCTYDIHRTYINPDAIGKQIFRVSRGVVLGFGCFMGLLAVILNKAGVSLGWMYLSMGVFVGSAVLPIAFMLLCEKQMQ